MSEALAAWIHLGDRYRSSSVAQREPDELACREGRRPVLITALHATPQRRDGAEKAAEPESGALAELWAEASGYWCLTAIGPQTGDGNWDLEHPFRDRVSALLDRCTLVIDLHMMLDRHGPDVCLGLGPCPDMKTGRLAALAAYEAEAAGVGCSINWPFPAAPRTLTAGVQARSASALQIEVATRLQRPADDAARASRLLAWLGRVDRHVAGLWG